MPPLLRLDTVLLPRRHAAADMPLLLVGAQHLLHALIQHRIERLEPRRDILMYGRFGYAKPCRGLAHGRIFFDHILREPDRAFFG